MARQYSLLLCLALACLASVCVHSEVDYAEWDYSVDKATLEAELTAYAAQFREPVEPAADQSVEVVASFASTKKNKKKSPPKAPKKSPPVKGGGGGSGGSITVGGGGRYSKVQDAVDAASSGSTITINGGKYYEKVTIPSSKQGLRLIGVNNPVISFGLSADKAGTLSKSATVSVLADNFYASGITFDNDFGFPNGRDGAQAVALLADASGVLFEGCTFTGHQDTLYALAGSQTYRNCKIVGQVDFIFGNAKAKFLSCNIVVVSNSKNRYTAVAAQRRISSGENTGFAFIGCSVSGGTGKTWRGRTWGKYATIIYSRTSFSGANPLGFTTMSDGSYKSTASVGCTDCDTSGFVSWALSTSAAAAVLSKLQ